MKFLFVRGKVVQPTQNQPNPLSFYMRQSYMKHIKQFSIITAGFFLLWYSSFAQGTTEYWDTDGTNPGLGVGGPYDWIADDLWNTDPAGGGAGVTGGWVNGDNAVFNGNGISIVTADTPVTCTNLYVGDNIGAGTNVVLDLTAGSVNCIDGIFIGYSGAGSATVNLSGDSILACSNDASPYPPQYVGLNGCSGTLTLSNTAYFTDVILDIGNSGAPGTVNLNDNSELYSWGNVVFGNSGNSTVNVNGGIFLANSTSFCNAANVTSVINLNGGTFVVTRLTRSYNLADTSSTCTLNLNGGVWAARSTANPSCASINTVNVMQGGAIFTGATNYFGGGNYAIYMQQDLLSGVSSGTDGGLTMIGPGTLCLYGQNTYTGGTTLSNNCTLNIFYWSKWGMDSTFSDSAFINILPGSTLEYYNSVGKLFTLASSQLLKGGGLVNNCDAVLNGLVAPGSGQNGSVGTLSFSGYTSTGGVTLAGTAWMKLNRNSNTNSDQIVSRKFLTYGGSLIVTNVGAALQAGDTFTLFKAAGGFNSSFASIVLPPLAGSLFWNTNQLATNGVISVGSTVVPPGVFANVNYNQVANGIVTFNATNATPNGAYTLLMTTNLTTPLNQWTPVATGNFDANGNLNGLSVTNNPPGSQAFFILKQ
jgi:hypothetical protein